jgi:PIN domain nuclease of toxin-antitoxin system
VRFLLDTHALLWWLFDDARLSSTARGIVSDPDHEILVSAASAWEISTKHRLGRLDSAAPLLADLPGWLVRAGFRELPISVAHARKAGGWRNDHRDPFDRMLAAQSALEDVPLLSRDPELEAFGVRLVW